MAEVDDSVSGTNLDHLVIDHVIDHDLLSTLLAADSHENQGDHDPHLLGSTSILQECNGDWFCQDTPLQPGDNDSISHLCLPPAASEPLAATPFRLAIAEEGTGNVNGLLRRHDQEVDDNMAMNNSIKCLPSCPLSLQESDGNESEDEDDVMSSECSEDEIQSEPTFKFKQVHFQVPEVGMAFSSEEETYRFYMTYAKKIGFKVRKGKVERKPDGGIRKRVFLCSREGFRSQKQPNKTTRYQRKETRTGCDAMIQFIVESGKWVISRFNAKHNHDLDGNSKLMVGSSTNISEDHSVSTTINRAKIVKETGTANSVEFHSVDCTSFFHDGEINCLQLLDGQSLINYFRHLQVEDPSFFYTLQVDDKNGLTNFFWMDGRSKIDYDYFGDVLIFDTTFRIDAYNMICIPFLGINHHGLSVLFGGAFLLNNSRDSFIWLFRTFLEAMGGHQPRTIFTDACQAMADAIEEVFPNTQHLLGIWYVLQNSMKHLSSYHRQPAFDSLFNKCIFDTESEEEFECMWESLLDQYDLHENQWLKDLYMLRSKWSHYSCKSIFSAGLRSIQGCESIGKIFHSLTNDIMSALQFVQQYLKVAEQQRREELYEDFRSNGSAGTIILRSNAMEKEAGNIYTSTMFKLFQEELLGCLSVAIEEIPSDGMTTTFKLTEEGHKEKYVEFNSLEFHVTCSCKKYESVGILCLHALGVLNRRNVFRIPSQYILKRWTKSAKNGIVVDGLEGEVAEESQRHLRTPKSRLMHKALNIITKSLATEETWKIVEDHFHVTLEKVEDVLRTKSIEHLNTKDVDVHYKDAAGHANQVGYVEKQQTVTDPPRTNQQEVSNNKTKSQLKRKHEIVLREMKCKSSDGFLNHHHPLKQISKGDDQGSRNGVSHSYCIEETSRKSACKSPRPPLPSQPTLHPFREASKSMSNIQESKKRALQTIVNRVEVAEKRIMVGMEELAKEITNFRNEKKKIFNLPDAVNSSGNQTNLKNKLICHGKSAMQHQVKEITGDKAKALNIMKSIPEQSKTK